MCLFSRQQTEGTKGSPTLSSRTFFAPKLLCEGQEQHIFLFGSERGVLRQVSPEYNNVIYGPADGDKAHHPSPYLRLLIVRDKANSRGLGPQLEDSLLDCNYELIVVVLVQAFGNVRPPAAKVAEKTSANYRPIALLLYL